MKIIQLTLLFTCLTAASLSGQSLKKGITIGMHVLDVELKPDVTMDQVLTFYQTVYIPAYVKEFKAFQGKLQGRVARAIRGEHQDQLALIWIFQETERSKFFTPEDQPNERGQQIFKNLEWVIQERNKLATVKSGVTDWVVQ